MANVNPVTDLVTALSGKMNLEPMSAVDIIELNGSETYSLHPQMQIIRVLSGRAWITINSEDRIVAEGDDTMLEQAKEPSVISSLSRRPLVFEIHHL
jgi:hypothetical protein